MDPEASPAQRFVDLLARRHVLGLLTALRGGPRPFGVLLAGTRGAPPQVSQRLRELREAGLVEVDEAGDYRLARQGRRLQGALERLEALAREWDALTPRQRMPRGATSRGRGEPG